jgi:hypothetical protein
MIEQRKSLRDPTGCARVLPLNLPHVYHSDRLCAPL